MKRFLDWLLRLLGVVTAPPAGETPDAVADRIDRYADRCAATGDRVGEEEARITAGDARRAPTTARALQLERDLYRKHGMRADGRPAKPLFGTRAGTAYVRTGRTVRAGGSRAWRYNNPGYVRCSDRMSSYGAIGCDGEWAIFETYDDGLRGFHRALQVEHPGQPLGEAVREMLPAEAAGEVLARLEQQGVDLARSVAALGEGAVNTLGSALSSATGWATGETFERGADAPGWVTDVWESPVPAGGPPPVTDNS